MIRLITIMLTFAAAFLVIIQQSDQEMLINGHKGLALAVFLMLAVIFIQIIEDMVNIAIAARTRKA